jgi:hypothetical protein
MEGVKYIPVPRNIVDNIKEKTELAHHNGKMVPFLNLMVVLKFLNNLRVFGHQRYSNTDKHYQKEIKNFENDLGLFYKRTFDLLHTSLQEQAKYLKAQGFDLISQVHDKQKLITETLSEMNDNVGKSHDSQPKESLLSLFTLINSQSLLFHLLWNLISDIENRRFSGIDEDNYLLRNFLEVILDYASKYLDFVHPPSTKRPRSSQPSSPTASQKSAFCASCLRAWEAGMSAQRNR